jgi:SAM-dependent methyltransferase
MLKSYLNSYKQINAWDNEFEYIVKITKKGKMILSKVNGKNFKELNLNHNRVKNYILKEGQLIEPLIEMGVFTKDGKIVNSMYDKYKQINKFIEIIDSALNKEKITEINVIDFGCGKSYLTFVLYYYLTKIIKIKTRIIGLDLKEEVIDKCNLIAKKYNYDGLTFEVGDINQYKCDFNVDIVITLHACDTATDYAIFNAIKWNAKYIFSVPCCQHELNNQIKSEKLNIIGRYGIAKERISAIFTDIIRCNLLEVCSYKTQLLEFIDFEHTPKNFMIKAKLSNIPSDSRNKMLKEVIELIKEFNLSPTLYNLLYKEKKFINSENDI